MVHHSKLPASHLPPAGQGRLLGGGGPWGVEVGLVSRPSTAGQGRLSATARRVQILISSSDLEVHDVRQFASNLRLLSSRRELELQQEQKQKQKQQQEQEQEKEQEQEQEQE